MSTNMKYAAECLNIALNSLRLGGGWGLEIRPVEPDTLLVVDKSGFELAAMRWEPDVFEGKSLLGTQMLPGWGVYLAVWDKGDESVGMAGSYELDLEGEPSYTYRHADEAALEIAQWFLREEVREACRCAGEYLWWQEQRDEEQV